ncbi:MAG: hypothetical protein GWN29_02230 [Gammaproteobacteria bacterium]|nr:hypothetical protein [Gammaproteobacteria bacterium]
MAGFNADKLGERLDELNREQLAAIEKLSEDLLTEMQRKGPIRAGDDERDTAVETGAKKRSARR